MISSRRSSAALLLVVGAWAFILGACGWGGPDGALDDTGGATSSVDVPVATTVVATTTTEAPPPPLDPTFVAIADRIQLTDEARKLLAFSQPSLVDKATLGSTCTLDPDLSVLGCYRAGTIAVLDVTDDRLDGMTETTTAHEVLHAAWHALTEDERVELTTLLNATFDRVATEEMVTRIDAYAARDPSVVDSELHSILGTEVRDVGPELEAYYGRWFLDRAIIVDLAETTRATFSSMEQQVADLDALLSQQRAQIESQETTLADDLIAIEAASANLEALRAAGQIDEYNAAVDPFNELVRLYNDNVAAHQVLIDEHNALVAQRNDVAAAYTDLVGQITTTVESLPA